jgi:hypothetical protein
LAEFFNRTVDQWRDAQYGMPVSAPNMNRFDNDPTPVCDPETIADPTPVTSPITPTPDLLEPPPVGRLNSSVDYSLDELRNRQLRTLTPGAEGDLEFNAGDLEFNAGDLDATEVARDIDEDDETVVSFPRVDIPRLDPVPVPPPSRPGSSTGPKRALQQELFVDLPEIDADPPPPLMVAPRPKVARRRLKTDARKSISGRVDLLRLTIAFLGGVIAASVVFLSLIYLRSQSQDQPKKQPSVKPSSSVAPKRPASTARARPAAPAPAPAPTPRAASVPEESRMDPQPVVKSEPASPVVAAGKRLAKALKDCQLNHHGQSLRIGVWVTPEGRIRKVYPAKRRWIQRPERRCIRRRLTGIKLGSFQKAGYIEWHLWLGRYPDATLLRRLH